MEIIDSSSDKIKIETPAPASTSLATTVGKRRLKIESHHKKSKIFFVMDYDLTINYGMIF